MTEGIIFDIKRFAIHDGPGIRTTVFLKGCPLKCLWCHNPESQPFGIVNLKKQNITVGRLIPAGEVIREVSRDTLFFDESGGGVTFSGGEPLAQPEFLTTLLDECGRLNIHRAVDTAGYAPTDVLMNIAERAELFLFDLKLADPARHMEFTGVDNALIQSNLKALAGSGAAIQIRIPVIPGITDGKENLSELASFIKSLDSVPPVKLLPYHRAAMDKYPRFDLSKPLPATKEPTQKDMAAARTYMSSLGLEVK